MLVAGKKRCTVRKNDFSGKNSVLPRIIADHLGSIRVTLDQNGNVDSWTDYYPFGKVSREGNSANEPKEGFTNYQHDVEMDLDYAGARFYNAAIGRFISVDPMLQFPSPFVYSGNNPIRYFDPSGMAARYLWGDDMGHSDDYIESVLKLRDKMTPEDKRKKDERDWVVGDQWWMERGSSGTATLGPGNGRFSIDSQGEEGSDDPPAQSTESETTTNGDGTPAGPGMMVMQQTFQKLDIAAKTSVVSMTLASFAYGVGTAGSSIPSTGIGTTFAQRLFVSQRFGVSSKLFGNSVTGTKGILNRPGLIKLGWSGTSRAGGGMQMRIGIGMNTINNNIARFHFYVPQTFVPNSYANPIIQSMIKSIGF